MSGESTYDAIESPDEVAQTRRLRLKIRGLVQGVGFRPFVYRLATSLGLSGWVRNSPPGVWIEVEGRADDLRQFIHRTEVEKPLRANIQTVESSYLEAAGYSDFTVLQSDQSGPRTALVSPDIATCPDCLAEMRDPANRRYRYPFTNCINCGPRYSIIESLPYDRAATTMKIFPMCRECQSEYEDPADRRFHAQPTACPGCGPHLELWTNDGKVLATHDEALIRACDAVGNGEILALKGLGGFQLLVDARNQGAVVRLRQLKAREEKPFALMYPTLRAVHEYCEVSELEQRLLCSPEAPIVLLGRRAPTRTAETGVSPSVAPGSPYLGVMLPYTPLHYLLMAQLERPVVATSGNLSDEPICINEYEALDCLGKIADVFLVHNRPIARHVDDSVAQVMMGREVVLRSARGYAPTSIRLIEPSPSCLAAGAHLKSSVAASNGEYAFVSQHIGDLTTRRACNIHGRVVESLSRLYDSQFDSAACDMHPDYHTTKFAFDLKLPVIQVQHHYAHVLSCMADNGLKGSVLGVSWDGTGLGSDGTVWGGEFLKVGKGGFSRVAHLRTFRLPGGEQAVREPRRSALGVLYEIFGKDLFSNVNTCPSLSFNTEEMRIVPAMLEKNINSPVTSSAGRLFDAVASIVGICQIARFEGQAAMKLEFAASDVTTDDAYRFREDEQPRSLVLDWEPMVRDILNDLRDSVSVGRVAAKFHNTLAAMIVSAATRIGEKRVLLTGGCFQNRYLAERVVQRLVSSGFEPFWHRRIPPNDGGLAMGQLMAALHR